MSLRWLLLTLMLMPIRLFATVTSTDPELMLLPRFDATIIILYFILSCYAAYVDVVCRYAAIDMSMLLAFAARCFFRAKRFMLPFAVVTLSCFDAAVVGARCHC